MELGFATGERRAEPAAGCQLHVPLTLHTGGWELWFDPPTVLGHGGDGWFKIWPLSILTSLEIALQMLSTSLCPANTP